MYNSYRSSQQGVRPGGGSYFRTPPGQRPHRANFNRQVPSGNKSAASNKPLGSKPLQTSPTNSAKQSENRTTEDSKSVFNKPTVEQSSSSQEKVDKKSTDTPLVQQSKQSLYSSLDDNTSPNPPPPQPPNNPPLSDSPPPLPPSTHPTNSLTSTDPVDTNKSIEPKKEDLSWSPPPPEPPQKPLSIPLTSETSQQRDTTHVPYGATLTHRTQFSGISQSVAKSESAPVIQNDPGTNPKTNQSLRVLLHPNRLCRKRTRNQVSFQILINNYSNNNNNNNKNNNKSHS